MWSVKIIIPWINETILQFFPLSLVACSVSPNMGKTITTTKTRVWFKVTYTSLLAVKAWSEKWDVGVQENTLQYSDVWFKMEIMHSKNYQFAWRIRISCVKKGVLPGVMLSSLTSLLTCMVSIFSWYFSALKLFSRACGGRLYWGKY